MQTYLIIRLRRVTEPQVSRKTNHTVRVIVNGRGMNLPTSLAPYASNKPVGIEWPYRMRLVQDNVASLISRNQPAPIVFLCEPSWGLREQACCRHVGVECRVSFFLCQPGLFGLVSEIFFYLETDGVT
jgi:hypothetical protein